MRLNAQRVKGDEDEQAGGGRGGQVTEGSGDDGKGEFISLCMDRHSGELYILTIPF